MASPGHARKSSKDTTPISEHARKSSKDDTPVSKSKASAPPSKTKDKKDKVKDSAAGPVELDPPPEFLKTRNELFERRKAERDAWIAKQPRDDIEIEMDNGSKREGKSWETSPASIAREISKSLFERTVIARVDGELWDLERPLEKSCKLELLDFDHPEGKKVFWHSSAHILGEAAERRWGCSLEHGPPTDDGFFYDMALPNMEAVTLGDYKPLQTIFDKAVKEKQPFERLELSKEDLLEMFHYNKYKQHIIKDKIPDGTSTTVYRNGPLIDLCRGPHVTNTGKIKAFEIMKNSSAYFLGDANNDSLQRIYGVSFPDKKQLDEHKHLLEEAAKRDHRKIGVEQELFFFHPMSPGSCFFLPNGTIIYEALRTFIKSEYRKRGYKEVHSPNMYNSALWKQSGHWQHYSEDMFKFSVEKEDWALKPMNCPGHCLLYGNRERSYRELPLRLAEFGVLHRNEASGALTGLTRVRRFVQDDSHIFCREDQIETEIKGLFDFLQAVYHLFGFSFKMKLSTMPEDHLGDVATWQRAEAQLQKALEDYEKETGTKWELNPGDGAFYGPKIDVTISDALRRDHQCATLQLDFNLPRQFNLEYRTEEQAQARPEVNGEKPEPKKAEAEVEPKATVELPIRSAGAADPEAAKKKDDPAYYRRELTPGCARPVMIHRALYGSFERFLAILCEHFGGKWPFWLSPRQILIVPINPALNDYCQELRDKFLQHDFYAEVDLSGNTFQWKVRNGSLQQYNFILNIGEEEKKSGSVNIRNRDDPDTHKRGAVVPLDEAIEKFRALRDERRLKNGF